MFRSGPVQATQIRQCDRASPPQIMLRASTLGRPRVIEPLTEHSREDLERSGDARVPVVMRCSIRAGGGAVLGSRRSSVLRRGGRPS